MKKPNCGSDPESIPENREILEEEGWELISCGTLRAELIDDMPHLVAHPEKIENKDIKACEEEEDE